MTTDIPKRLQALSDADYAVFQRKLLPTISSERIIGVRTPALRGLAKEMLKEGEADDFLATLPHPTFDENQLHAFILSEMKNFPRCLSEVERFLPHVDNWATCDQLSPKSFRRHASEILPHIGVSVEGLAVGGWLQSPHEFTVRFGIGMLMQHFLDDDTFVPCYLDAVAAIRRDEYYIRMMQAWYFATALAKQYDATLPILTTRRLDPWTHNRTIQKAIESFRITSEQKAALRTLKVKS
ncbi:MAG: DNA alkylation repair protein [Bacteroidaceae bacterium]|nr:DNA alkylation repair protein [Bacteroidaceae bacterium]